MPSFAPSGDTSSSAAEASEATVAELFKGWSAFQCLGLGLRIQGLGLGAYLGLLWFWANGTLGCWRCGCQSQKQEATAAVSAWLECCMLMPFGPAS